MFVKDFGIFLLERKKHLLSYHIYDWDDNILVMPTVIHMEKKDGVDWVPEDVSTAKFSIIRNKTKKWKLLNGDPKQAYSEFGDNGERKKEAFFEDSLISIKNKEFGPSWSNFIECMVKGRLFAIVTSRHHLPDSMRKVVEWIIYNKLSDNQQNEMINNIMYYHGLFGKDIDYVIDQYLDKCGFFGIGDPLNSYISNNLSISSDDFMEKRKEKAIKYFKNRLVKYGNRIGADIKIGFSDDDKKMSSHMVTFMGHEKELDFLAYRNRDTRTKVDYYVYDTSDPKNVNKIKV